MSVSSEKSLSVVHEPAVESGHGGAPSPLSQRVRSLQLPSQKSAGDSRTGWIAWALCVLFAASTAVLGYVVATREPAPAPGDDPAADPPPGGSPSLPAGEIALHSRGYVIPSHQLLISPQVSGRIAALKFREGDRIDKEKDDVLAILETTDYDADLRRARSALESAQHKRDELQATLPEETIQVGKELEEAKAQLDPLQKAFERNRKLKEANSAFVSDQDLEESESRCTAAKRRVERLTSVLKLMTDGTRQNRILAAEADVRQAQAELDKAQWRLDNCTIRAPISGTILRKNAEIGNLVNPIAMNGSYSLCEMADLCDLEVEVDVPDRDLAKVFDGQKCTVYAEAYPERKYEGEARLMPIANRSKGALPVRVKVKNIPRQEEGRYLKPDMGAMVIFWNAKSAKGGAAPPANPPAREAASVRPAPTSQRK